jgi:hypothetical protein
MIKQILFTSIITASLFGCSDDNSDSNKVKNLTYNDPNTSNCLADQGNVNYKDLMTFSCNEISQVMIDDLTQFPNLENVWIDISNSESLSSALDFTPIEKLKDLFLLGRKKQYGNSEPTYIESLHLSNRYLESIELSSLGELQELNLSHNPNLKTIDLTTLPNVNSINLLGLTQLNSFSYFGYNNFDEKAEGNSHLYQKGFIPELNFLESTSIKKIDVQGLMVKQIKLAESPYLTSLNLFKTWMERISPINIGSSESSISNLSIQGTQLNNIELQYMPGLCEFTLTDSPIKNLDLSNNQQLCGFNLSNLELENIDLTFFSELISADLSDNEITTIDLNNTPDMKVLNLEGNPLTQETINYLGTVTWIDDLKY